MPSFISRKTQRLLGLYIYLLNGESMQGIYPTLIIILVALDKSEIDKQSRAWSLPTIRTTVQPSHPQVEVATDAIRAEDANEDGNMRPDSVVLIGMPSSFNRSSTQMGEATSEDVTIRGEWER